MKKIDRPVMYAKGSDPVGNVRVTSQTVPIFEGEAIIKVPDDGQKRVALTRKELEEKFNKPGIFIGILTQNEILDDIFGEETNG